MKNLILLIGIVSLLCFQTTHAQTYDYLKSATDTGNDITPDNSKLWDSIVSVTIDVTNVSHVMLTASINMRPDGGHTNGREANYRIFMNGSTANNSGIIKRQIIRNGESGVESWGIGTLVHIFDVSGISGDTTYTLEHSNQGASDAGRNVYSTARLTAVALTTATNQYELSCDNKSIPDAGVSTTSSTFEAVAGLTTGTITLPIKGDIFVIASINSEIHTAGSTVAEYRLESSPDGTTWTALGKPVKRTVVNAYDDGIISLVCILQDQNQGTNYKFRVAHRQVSGQTVYTTNTNIVAVALAHSGGGYFPSFCSEVDDTGVDVDWGDSYELVTSSTFTAAADISSTGTSLFVSSQYLVDATNLQTSTTPDERMRAGNQLYVNDGTTTTSAEEYYRYISDNSNFGAGGFIGLMTDLVSEGSYTIGMNHIVKYVSNHTDPKTEILTTSNVILTGFQTYDRYSYNWDGSTDTDWATPANWSSIRVPGTNDNVTIPSGLSTYPLINETAACYNMDVFGSLTIGTSGDLDVNTNGGLFILEGGAVTVNDGTLDATNLQLIVDLNETANSLTISGGTTTVTDLLLNNSNSTLTVSGGHLDVTNNLDYEYGTITFSGGTVDVGGYIDSYGTGSLTVESTSATSTGSLIVVGTPYGDITVKRYVASAAWHLVSPSTTGVTNTNFYISPTQNAWLTKFNEADGDGTDGHEGEWEYIVTLGTALSVGTGYSYFVDGTSPANDHTVSFEGAIRTTDLSPTITWAADAKHGFNLIGNPFPSALYWDNTWSLTRVDATIYIWNNGSNNYTAKTTGDTYNIPVGQGFFVKANAASPAITIPKAKRVHNTQAFLKSTTESAYTNYLTLRANNNQYWDEVKVSFQDNASEGFDDGWDATKMFGPEESPQLYIVEQNRKQSYNHLPLMAEGEERTVAMSYIPGAEGIQTLTVDMENFHDADVLLEDLLSGATQDLKQNPVYTFSGSKEDSPQRFLLHFGWSPDGIDEAMASNINIYSYGKDVYIRSSEDAINQKANVFVYDMLGREILSTQIQGNELEKISVNVENAYVVVKVVKDGFVKTEKVFIK